MNPGLQPVRSGWGKALLFGLVTLLLGLAFGRWVFGGKADSEKIWQNVDELHQLYMVPSSYNFVETNKSYESHLISLIHDRLLHYDAAQNQLVPGLARTYEAST